MRFHWIKFFNTELQQTQYNKMKAIYVTSRPDPGELDKSLEFNYLPVPEPGGDFNCHKTCSQSSSCGKGRNTCEVTALYLPSKPAPVSPVFRQISELKY